MKQLQLLPLVYMHANQYAVEKDLAIKDLDLKSLLHLNSLLTLFLHISAMIYSHSNLQQLQKQNILSPLKIINNSHQ